MTFEKIVDVHQKWDLKTKVKAVTTDIASDMVKVIKILPRKLNNEEPAVERERNGFYFRCLTHVIVWKKRRQW